ncbi:MAG: hypothetical protein KDA46_00295 [Parvularculaceae bacterium]|nr:hypothetical protein [Parvularculaceae bacterium]
MSDVELDYDFLTQRALIRVVRDVLEMTEELGVAPGDHHFYIEFDTKSAGVSVPDHLLESYPTRMTIVLQHQFENLEVREDEFAVTLWFKGKQARLIVPYTAITSFADPSVQFGLRFDALGAEGEKPETAAGGGKATPKVHDEVEEEEAPAKIAEGASVVQLDAFRKK